ncbi:MAG: sulfatase-like hydrolase/transferase [Bacteroidales bacterium]|nr:sulfatase-like hydrolase/transferase [Bacteroidales bacterium]
MICSSDIPFFKQFFTRINYSVFLWADTPIFGLKMIAREPSYYIYFFLFLAFSFLFAFIGVKLYKKFLINKDDRRNVDASPDYILNLTTGILALIIMFIGIRGRIEKKSPIKVGTAFFSNYSFPNQLGLNPVFTFIRSYLDAKNSKNAEIKLIDNAVAINNVKRFLNIKDSLASPLARQIKAQREKITPNIIVVIMESFSAEYMQRFGNQEKLTPVMDSLAAIAYSFDNIYTAGIHTYNGIYSTLFSFPTIFTKHPLNKAGIDQYTGLSGILASQNYYSLFFIPHDEQFDNISGFLKQNAFNEIISQKDYPASKVLSTLGVPDNYMFDFSINTLKNIKQPFLAVYMTASNHGPYIVPTDIAFKPKALDIKKQCLEYSDWALGDFLHKAKTQEWFENTIFLFVADHGAIIGDNPYPVSLSYHHTPFVIYSPLLKDAPKSFNCIGGQLDIFPTLMGLINIEYINNTMGIDLLREKRPYIYFCDDDKIGCLDHRYLYIYSKENLNYLYEYNKKDVNNYYNILTNKADSMKNYAFSMLQAAQFMIINKKTSFH